MSDGTVVTIADLPTEEPIPVAYPPATSAGTAGVAAPVEAPIQEHMADMEVQFVAINGEPASVLVDPTDAYETRKTLCLASCCPCCVGGITSPERMAELRKLFRRVTFWVVVVQLVMFVVSLVVGGGFASLEENQLLGPTTLGLVKSGAKYTYAILHGGVHRLVMPLLLHGGIVHLVFNIWAELVLCMYAEHLWGGVRLFLAFFAAGIGATLFSAILTPDVISVGASGAVMGIMALLLVNVFFVCVSFFLIFLKLTWNGSVTSACLFLINIFTGKGIDRPAENQHDEKPFRDNSGDAASWLCTTG